MSGQATHRVRLQLSEAEARALHAGLLNAMAADLLSPTDATTAQRVLDRLSDRVPTWLDRAPIGGEAGYLIAAEAVLRALTDGEERGRSALSEIELNHALADAKPVGVTITEVLTRMRHERLVRRGAPRGSGEFSWTGAPAGRRFLAGRDGTASREEWRVNDAEGLTELIFREHRPGSEAHRPSVQAIGQLYDERLEQLIRELRVAGLLEPTSEDAGRLVLTPPGRDLAERRVRFTLVGGALLWDLPAPPLPFRRGLPLRVERSDCYCSCGTGHAAWLERSSRTKLRQTLLRDGAVEWNCRWCARRWLIYLQAQRPDGTPAYGTPAAGVYNRVVWRPR